MIRDKKTSIGYINSRCNIIFIATTLSKAEIEYSKKRPLGTEIQTLLQRSWLWFPGCLLDRTYQKPTSWNLLRRYLTRSTVWNQQSCCWEAASSAGLSALSGAGHLLQDRPTEPPVSCLRAADAGQTQEQGPFLWPL